MTKSLIAFLAVLFLGSAAAAGDRATLGWGRLFSNDGLGASADRWRTGGLTLSAVRGPSWQGALPGTLGEVLEFRVHGEIVSPESLTAPAADDRRYAGLVGFGVHTHADLGGWETSLGLDLIFTGPQTHLDDLQAAIHKAVGLPRPTVPANQIGNGLYPTLVAEFGRGLPLGQGSLRPFVEMQAGLETLVRVGADLSLGGHSDGALMLRETTTGQRYRAVAGNRSRGFSLSLGGDIAHVFDSALLPGGEGAVLNDTRTRLRAGVAWQGETVSAFYGLTWLGKEFDTQRESQFVGSLGVNFRF